MIGTRYEVYENFNDGLPFVFHAGLVRSPALCSKEQNWHEAIEIQLCEKGEGTVLINGDAAAFREGDLVVVNSNEIHYTYTDRSLIYSCLIVGDGFCRRMGLDPRQLRYVVRIQDPLLTERVKKFAETFKNDHSVCRVARLNEMLLGILIELTDHYAVSGNRSVPEGRIPELVKGAIWYIREHYRERILLDDVARSLLTDKYKLCRDFKRMTGQTMVEYANRYRCRKAAELIAEGFTVARSARECGFENLSFFTRTFKKYMGKLPSEYRTKPL